MTIRPLFLALCLLFCGQVPAFAKGSAVIKEAPWDPHHIGDLPTEVRQYITSICKGPARAQHDFAVYLPHEKRWRINLEYLECSGKGDYRHGSLCLDVDFVDVGSHFRFADKQYRACGF